MCLRLPEKCITNFVQAAMTETQEKTTAISVEKQQPETREEVHDGSFENIAPEGTDVTLEWFEVMRTVPAEELEAESKRVRRKIDCILMPIVCWTYALQYLDNTVLGYAYAYGLLQDTNMSEGEVIFLPDGRWLLSC